MQMVFSICLMNNINIKCLIYFNINKIIFVFKEKKVFKSEIYLDIICILKYNIYLFTYSMIRGDTSIYKFYKGFCNNSALFRYIDICLHE